MRVVGAVSLLALVSGCAFPKHVERFGVEYNTALAGMSNEQTLLNILRARDGMPTHFTSVSQFRGNLNLTAAASANAGLRGEGLTRALTSGFTNSVASTATTVTTVPAGGGVPGVTTTATTVSTPASSGSNSRTITEGVDVYTPQISGQIFSGTAFDVNVFDTQKFYQGITGSIPFSTVEALLSQGFENRVIAALTIARVDFRVDKNELGLAEGTTILRFVNDPANPAEAAKFARFVNCYELGSEVLPGNVSNIVAISRVTTGADGKPIPLPLDKVVLIDGEKIGLSAASGIGSDPTGDDEIYLTRLTGPKRLPKLSPRVETECAAPGFVPRDVNLMTGGSVRVVVPQHPDDASDPVYLGNAHVLRLGTNGIDQVPVKMEVTFRSPEGLFRYLGSYLANNGALTIPIRGQPLFSIAEGRDRNALAEVRYRGASYRLVNDVKTGPRNAHVFTLLQQLINLHKEASDRPTVIPVRAIP